MNLRLKVLVTAFPYSEQYVTQQLRANPAIGELVYSGSKEKLASHELAQLISKHQPQIIIAGTEHYTPEILKICPALQLISVAGSEHNIDVDTCHELGIIVTTTPDTRAYAVAEFTLAQMIMLARKIPMANQHLNSGIFTRPIGKDLSNCFIGIIGYGRVGHALQNMLSTIFSPVIFVDDIDKNRLQHARDRGCNIATKEYIFSTCDIISIHTPITDETKNMVTAKQLATMKKDVILINNSHIDIVNFLDLNKFFITNTQASAALDLQPESFKTTFAPHPNAYLTPRIAGNSQLSRQATEKAAVDNVLKFVDTMQNEITFLNKL